MNFDVIIIGGGAAGLSASLWCDDLGLNSLLLEAEKEFGGQLLWTYNAIENHLGVKVKNGRKLTEVFLEQMSNRKFINRLQVRVKEINAEKKCVLLDNGDKIFARAIIIATGIRRRKLNIKGEDEFHNKGILRSGKLDKDLVKDKVVMIVGGGDAALENALILSETASKVFLTHRRREFRARDEFIERVKNQSNVEILFETILTRIIGNEKIEKVEAKNLKTGEILDFSVDAILVRIGVEPNTDFLDGKIESNEKGYIKVNGFCETNFPGIYAVGDVANPVAPTVSSAVGMGATAVKSILAWLNK